MSRRKPSLGVPHVLRYRGPDRLAILRLERGDDGQMVLASFDPAAISRTESQVHSGRVEVTEDASVGIEKVPVSGRPDYGEVKLGVFPDERLV
ncbi:MAG TPA: hypothetical protein VMG58_01130, partial [Candidatus Sulfotelmatobacter sp.]|nr:hypothetical protein [Candidatus Sulfotelmatobacter sp.]